MKGGGEAMQFLYCVNLGYAVAFHLGFGFGGYHVKWHDGGIVGGQLVACRPCPGSFFVTSQSKKTALSSVSVFKTV